MLLFEEPLHDALLVEGMLALWVGRPCHLLTQHVWIQADTATIVKHPGFWHTAKFLYIGVALLSSNRFFAKRDVQIL